MAHEVDLSRRLREYAQDMDDCRLRELLIDAAEALELQVLRERYGGVVVTAGEYRALSSEDINKPKQMHTGSFTLKSNQGEQEE